MMQIQSGDDVLGYRVVMRDAVTIGLHIGPDQVAEQLGWWEPEEKDG